MKKTASLIQFLLLALIFTAFTSCSEYNKVLKSNDNELKKNKGLAYYEAGDYLKAIVLLEEVIPH